jgi:hypothetical protein
MMLSTGNCELDRPDILIQNYTPVSVAKYVRILFSIILFVESI